MRPPRIRMRRVLAAAMTIAIVAGMASCGDDDAGPDRAALIDAAKRADPTLDDPRAGCLVDGLTDRLGAGHAATILESGPDADLAPEDADVVVSVAMACTGAPGVKLPVVPAATTTTTAAS
jgi:hypothetical protein